MMKEIILSLFAEMLGTPLLTEGTRIEEIEGFDSLQFVILLSELQERYGISIPVDKALEIGTVAELIACAEAASGRVA